MSVKKVIAVVSGGMDSTTLVHWLMEEDGFDQQIDLVSFNYGQRHKKELAYAARLASSLDLRHDIVQLGAITPLLAEGGSSLVSDTPVPHGHYAAENMAKTIVPNRNMIMMAIAGGIAVARGAEKVATGVHAGDHAIYPDCRPAFLNALEETLQVANDKPNFEVIAPFTYYSKEDIASVGIALGVDFSTTWSCYEGGEVHCGRCGTCVERIEAIAGAATRVRQDWRDVDKTEYSDETFWRQAVEAGA
jgi:7-cyano-7-deazaguanine synthase